MSRNYYYFVSSLPFLHFGQDPPMRSEAFIEAASYQLTEGEANALAVVSLVPREGHCCETERRWNAFETNLRNALSRIRASRTQVEAQPFLRTETDAFGGLEGQIQEALGKDPLEMEIQLDRIRWQFLGDQEVGHGFDMGALFSYRIKLLLLEKRLGLDCTDGQDQVNRHVTEKLEPILLECNIAIDAQT